MPDRRSRYWATTRLAFSLSGTSTSVQNALSDLETELGITNLRGVTIGAIHGNVAMLPVGGDSASTIHECNFGIGVFPSSLQTAGVPVPFTDSWGWMWTWPALYRPKIREHSVGGFEFEVAAQRIIDVRSMRKIGMNESLFLISRNEQALTVNIKCNLNILILK